MERPLSGICILAVLAVAGAQMVRESEHGSIRGYGVQDVYSYQSGMSNVTLKDATFSYAVDSTLKEAIFGLEIQQSVVDNYDWYGVALKKPSDSISMIDADFTVVFFNNYAIEAMNTFGAKTNGRPNKDTKNSIQLSEVSLGKTRAFWYRALDTPSDETIALKEGQNYTLLYAYGKLKNGVMQKHEGTNRGYTTIQLMSHNPSDDSAFSLYTLLILSVLQLLF